MKSDDSPGKAFTAMDLWVEVPKDKKTAMRFYGEALGSFLDRRLEIERRDQ